MGTERGNAMDKKNLNARPKKLTRLGGKAHTTIMRVLKSCELTDTGGCKSFYSPKEWKERNERYGTESELIVVYDGGDLRPFFNINEAMEWGYTFSEKMRLALEEIGLYTEECTGWYCAVYKM